MARPKPSWVGEIERGLHREGCAICVSTAATYRAVRYAVTSEAERLGWKLSVKTAPDGDGYLITRKG